MISFKAREIVGYMHEERAYKETAAGDIIPFSLAKEIKNADTFYVDEKPSGT